MNKNSIKNRLAAVIALLAIVATAPISSALACSRLVTETEHGTLLIRSADWVSSAPFDAHVSVFPVGSEREMRGEVPGYAKAYSSWTTKYHTISFEEHGAFEGLSGQTVNDQGLSVMALSQGDSKPYLAQHQDNGAPAVNISDVTTFIAENYATTAEVKSALDQGSFQMAWAAAPAGLDHAADLHFSVVDKEGQILLIQLGKGGVVNYHQGDAASDLRVKTNDPFIEGQRAYNAQYDLKDPKVASQLPWGITGKDRYARLLAMSEQLKLDGLTYEQAAARQQSSFDFAAIVPFGVHDPATGEDYPSFFTTQFNLDKGDIRFRSMMTGGQIDFSVEETKRFKAPMHAEIMKQADAGASQVTWNKM